MSESATLETSLQALRSISEQTGHHTVKEPYGGLIIETMGLDNALITTMRTPEGTSISAVLDTPDATYMTYLEKNQSESYATASIYRHELDELVCTETANPRTVQKLTALVAGEIQRQVAASIAD